MESWFACPLQHFDWFTYWHFPLCCHHRSSVKKDAHLHTITIFQRRAKDWNWILNILLLDCNGLPGAIPPVTYRNPLMRSCFLKCIYIRYLCKKNVHSSYQQPIRCHCVLTVKRLRWQYVPFFVVLSVWSDMTRSFHLAAAIKSSLDPWGICNKMLQRMLTIQQQCSFFRIPPGVSRRELQGTQAGSTTCLINICLFPAFFPSPLIIQPPLSTHVFRLYLETGNCLAFISFIDEFPF